MTTTKPRIEAVEIKVTIGRGAMQRAIQGFGLDPAHGEARAIYFCEQDASLPLLDAGLILRLREKAGSKGDSTIKLRPLEVALEPRWDVHEIDDTKIRVEADWVDDRKVAAASVVADQRPGDITGVARGTRSLHKAFSAVQLQFLHAHQKMPVHVDGLQVLGPIDAVKWETTALGFPEDIVAERWLVGSLAFLELSIRIKKLDRAEAAQKEFQAFIERAGFSGADLEQETKTKRVLQELTRR